MNKTTAIVLISIIVLAIGLFYILKPELFAKVIPWLVGLGGSALAGIKGLFSSLTGGESLHKLEQENQKLKNDLQQINLEVVTTNEKLGQIQKKYELDMTVLQSNLEKEKLARKALFERTRRTLTDPESTFETKLSPAMQE